jgi:hypothetical protein
LHMQWPLTSRLHGSVSQREQLVFLLWIKLLRVGVILSHFDLLQVYELQITSLRILIVRIEWKKFWFIPNYWLRISTRLFSKLGLFKISQNFSKV